MRAEAKDPATENKIVYEKRVPEIKFWTKIFKRTRRKNWDAGKMKRLRIIGAFARPSRKNGKGLGIANSTAEKKRQRAVKKARIFLF